MIPNSPAKPSLSPEEQEVYDHAAEALKTLLRRNKSAFIIVNSGVELKPFCVIRGLWNDESLGFLATPAVLSSPGFIDLVENVTMPERLSAIYHVDQRKIEVIWTSYTRPDHLEDVVGREFEYEIGNQSHKCAFAPSSGRLLELAKYVILYGLTDSGYRNLQSFDLLQGGDGSDDDKGRLADPISFYVENVDWHDEKTIALLSGINFYMRYFDALSPQVVIHEPNEATPFAKRSRYVDKSFPPKITAKALDPTLTSFRSAGSREKDSARRFLYLYRLIEYVSFFYMDDAARGTIRRILSGPNTSGNIRAVTDKVVEVVRESKGDEYSRFKAVILDLVDDKHIFREVSASREYFSNSHDFDGGFKLKALLANTDAKSLGDHGMDNFVTTLKDIRNALSHGRDQKSGQVILPTLANLKRLQPWANLIATAAAEVVLYEGVG